MPSDNIRSIGHDSRFKPGQSGNPSGRPHKRRALTDVLKDVLSGDTLLGMKTSEIYKQVGKDISTDDDPSVARLMLECAIAHFISKGNPSILAAVLDRTDGPAKLAEPIVEPDDEALTCDDEALAIYDYLEKSRALKKEMDAKRAAARAANGGESK